VNWAKLFTKAKENHARSSRLAARGRPFVFGAIFAGAGALSLYTKVTHQLHSKAATGRNLDEQSFTVVK
jgi:hypothetical protein